MDPAPGVSLFAFSFLLLTLPRPQVLASLFLFYDSCHRQINGHSSANPNPIKLLKYALKNMFNVSRWHEMQCHCKFFSLLLCFAAAAFSSEWLLRFWSLTFFTWASGPSRRSERTRLLAYCHLCNNSYEQGEARAREKQQGQQQQKQQPSEFIRGVIFRANIQVVFLSNFCAAKSKWNRRAFQALKA